MRVWSASFGFTVIRLVCRVILWQLISSRGARVSVCVCACVDRYLLWVVAFVGELRRLRWLCCWQQCLLCPAHIECGPEKVVSTSGWAKLTYWVAADWLGVWTLVHNLSTHFDKGRMSWGFSIWPAVLRRAGEWMSASVTASLWCVKYNHRRTSYSACFCSCPLDATVPTSFVAKLELKPPHTPSLFKSVAWLQSCARDKPKTICFNVKIILLNSLLSRIEA